MALEPAWQPNYVDLSDDRVVRFGARCVVCGARFVTADMQIPPGALAAPPDSPQARALDEQKYRFFVEFASAFRELAIECFRCERTACPDCWDDDNGMCGACVETHRLPRSPQRGQLMSGPLADGRLRRIEPGQFSDASRPSWLNQLLASQPQGSTLNRLQSGVSDAEWERVLGAAMPAPPPPAPPPPAPYAPPLTAPYAPPLTAPYAPPLTAPYAPPLTAPYAPPLTAPYAPPALAAGPFASPPRPSSAQEPAARTSTVTPPPAFDGASRASSMPPAGPSYFESPESRPPSTMVACPNCGTANFDFVTNCTVCQMPLIQICSVCDKLSPGNARQCEHCGAPLDRSQGWANVQAPVTRLPAEETRNRAAGAAAPKPKRNRITGRRAHAKQEAPPAPAAAAFASAVPAFPSNPATPALAADAVPSLPIDSQPALDLSLPLHHEEAPRSPLEEFVAIVERISTIALWIIILGVAGIVIACELSPSANAALRGVLHIDIQLTLAHFWTAVQLLLARMRR